MRASVLGLVVLATVGCSGKPDVHAEQSVGASGGTVTASDGTSVELPPGALGGNTTITITSSSDAPTPSGVSSVGTPYVLGPEGTQFAMPVTGKLVIDPSKLPSGKTA